MLKNLEDLKQFVLWCKSNKIKAFKNNDIEFELSDLAFVEAFINNEPGDILKDVDLPDSDTFAEMDPEGKQEDEDLLYWSSQS